MRPTASNVFHSFGIQFFATKAIWRMYDDEVAPQLPPLSIALGSSQQLFVLDPISFSFFCWQLYPHGKLEKWLGRRAKRDLPTICQGSKAKGFIPSASFALLFWSVKPIMSNTIINNQLHGDRQQQRRQYWQRGVWAMGCLACKDTKASARRRIRPRGRPRIGQQWKWRPAYSKGVQQSRCLAHSGLERSRFAWDLFN